jgi:hypothetical protein
MEVPPLQQECDDATRQVTVDRTIPNPDRTLVALVPSVKVRWVVFPIVHGDQNAEELADDRHAPSLPDDVTM